jgi:hypothetical protein
MSNTFTKAAFTLLMNRDDAGLLRTAQQAVDILDTNGDDADLAAGYDTLGERFHAVFPAQGPHRFGSFLKLFDDWHFPYLDATIEIEDDPAETQVKVTFSGDQFGVAQVAELIFQGCKSALPCGFAWSYDADRLRVGEFGGGCVVITEAGVAYHNTGDILAAALRAITAGLSTADEFVFKVAAPRPGFDSYEDGYDPTNDLAAIITEARRIANVTPAPDAPEVEP